MSVPFDNEKASQGSKDQYAYTIAEARSDADPQSEAPGDRTNRGVLSLQERVVVERRFVRKLDLRFVSTITLLYIVNYIVVSDSARLDKSTLTCL